MWTSAALTLAAQPKTANVLDMRGPKEHREGGARTPRAILMALAVAGGVGACNGRDDMRVGSCEGGKSLLTIRTSDRRPTIASVELEPSNPPFGCTTDSPCGPMFRADAGSAPCSELDVWGVDRCTVRLTSVTGRVVTVESRVKPVPGSEHKCRDDRGYLRDVVHVAFNPSLITVDFSSP